MYVVSFHPIFNENAILLSKRMGIPFITDLNPEDGDILVVFGAHQQADKLFYLQQVKKIHYILIQSEQYSSEVFDQKYYMELVQNHSLLDFSRFNVEKLKSKIECKVFSFYFFDFIIPDLTDWDSRPIDFFFCGSDSKERRKKLDEFKQENPSANIEFDFSYSYTNPIAMTEKLKQVKYVINLPYYEKNALETHRINRALSAGCEVISVYSKDKYFNKHYSPYVHFVRELTDFTLLLEQERKGDYVALMEDFGFKSIESNIHGIQHAERNWLNAYKKIEGKENVQVS